MTRRDLMQFPTKQFSNLIQDPLNGYPQTIELAIMIPGGGATTSDLAL